MAKRHTAYVSELFMNEQAKSKLAVICSMCIFGTIGLLRNNIIYSSGLIALIRGAIGVLTLLAVMLMSGKRFRFAVVKKYLPLFPDRVYRNIYQGGLMNELV